jgi:hypothetical protein
MLSARLILLALQAIKPTMPFSGGTVRSTILELFPVIRAAAAVA